MNSEKIKTPFTKYLLIFLVSFQSISAIFGAINLLFKPFKDSSMEQPLSTLEGTPFNNFIIPGLILLILLGLYPLLIVYGLIKRPNWKRANSINIYKTMHWSWTYALYLGIMLVLWIDFQVFFIGYGSILQTIYAFLGVVIIIVTLLPGMIKYYTSEKNGEN